MRDGDWGADISGLRVVWGFQREIGKLFGMLLKGGLGERSSAERAEPWETPRMPFKTGSGSKMGHRMGICIPRWATYSPLPDHSREEYMAQDSRARARNSEECMVQYTPSPDHGWEEYTVVTEIVL